MKKLKYFIPSFILMFIIFMFSNQNGENSSGLSLNIVYFIQKIFPFFKSLDILHFIIRKAAHMSEYALLTLSFFYGFYHYFPLSKKTYLISILSTFLYACTDEWHQLFIGGRAGQFQDVCIDTSGGIIALVIIFLVFKHFNHN